MPENLALHVYGGNGAFPYRWCWYKLKNARTAWRQRAAPDVPLNMALPILVAAPGVDSASAVQCQAMPAANAHLHQGPHSRICTPVLARCGKRGCWAVLLLSEGSCQGGLRGVVSTASIGRPPLRR